LEISVFGAQDFDKKEVRVSGAGIVVLPLIGSVHVSGLTIDQTRQVIQKKLSDGLFYNDPQVSVFVKEYPTEGVSVLGEVLKPGVYPLLGPRRLFDAISLAGGLTPRAGRVVTVTRRDDPQHPQTLTWNNDGQTPTESNVQVFPGDTIVVAKAGIVYVVGDVKKPGGFIMENGHLSVLQAVAMAEGPTPTAALDQAKLIRSTPSGHQEVPIDLKKIMKSQATDVALLPEDTVFVPNSVGKSASRRTLDTILQVTTGMAIYGRVP
jgi:polysaccharide export outer membrane protein